MTTRNSEPSPGTLSTVTCPPCALTSSLTIDNPMPAPPVARERDFSPRQNRVKTCGRSAAGMPMPVSVTSSTASSPAVRTTTLTRPPRSV